VYRRKTKPLQRKIKECGFRTSNCLVKIDAPKAYPVKTIFFRMIRSGSTLFSEPIAAMAGCSPSLFFKTIRGSGGKEIGAYTEATENRPWCRNLSILCLLQLMLSDENNGLRYKRAVRYLPRGSVKVNKREEKYISPNNIKTSITLL
jgi:hypothetical protein